MKYLTNPDQGFFLTGLTPASVDNLPLPTYTPPLLEAGSLPPQPLMLPSGSRVNRKLVPL